MWTDYNNDGFLDLFVSHGNGNPHPNFLYQNNLPALGNENHWLKVRLEGRISNRAGIGAKVSVQATVGGRTFWQMRGISGSSIGNADGPLLIAHFGLGDTTNVTTLRVEWPSGIVQELSNVAADQHLTIVESQVTPPPGPAPAVAVANASAAGLQLTIQEPAAGARYALEASTDLRIGRCCWRARVPAGRNPSPTPRRRTTRRASTE